MGIINEIEIEIFSDYAFQMSCDGRINERTLRIMRRIREVLMEEWARDSSDDKLSMEK